MSHLVAWVKEQMRKSHLKELIKNHTGLAPPAFFAVVALAAAGTALTVSAVLSFLAPPKKNDRLLDAIIEEEIMPYTTSNQREVDVIPVVHETPIVETTEEEEEEGEDEAPANDADVPKEEAEAPKEEVETPVKEETVETEALAADGEDNISSGYVGV
jgi:hypothetical protein